MIVTRKTLRDQRRAITGWAIGMTALVLMYTAFYPSIKNNAAQLNKYLESLPEALRNIVGRAGDFSSPTGYLQSEIFSTMGPLLLLILAIGAGARAIAGEEEARTLDLLLACPVSRRRVLWEKFAALIASCAGIGVVMWTAIAVLGPPFGLRMSLANLAATVLSVVLLAIAFGAIALAIGSWRGHRGLAVGVTAAVAVTAYLLDVLAPSVKSISGLQKLSPFYYYIANDPLQHGLDPLHVLVLIAIAAVALGLALIAFERRDLTA